MNRQRHPSRPRLAILVGAVLSLVAATTLFAQQRPLTANHPQASSASVPIAPAPPMPMAASPGHGEIGSTTRSLFRLQAEQQRPGSLPTMPGQAATAAYQRYLKSFEHPLPEFYENKLVGSGGPGGGSLSGGN